MTTPNEDEYDHVVTSSNCAVMKKPGKLFWAVENVSDFYDTWVSYKLKSITEFKNTEVARIS